MEPSTMQRSKPPKVKSGIAPYLSSRDAKILEYIWKWKIASTASIHEAVNRPQSEYSTTKVLERLKTNGFILDYHHPRERFYVWSLTEYGFAATAQYLGEIAEEGYLSENHRHDRLVQAFQLGEWSTHQNPRVLFFTEQDLRRRSVEYYPSWVPHTTEHRPDGYTRIAGSKRQLIFAYEVELSAKSTQKYEGILRFYKLSAGIDRVFWLVGDPFIKDQILSAKSCIKDDSTNYHVFVDINDYEKHGWDAQVTNERSETLFTMREKYQELCGDLMGEIIGTLRGQSSVSVHLDKRKLLGKPRR
jgi:hypothetical protein